MGAALSITGTVASQATLPGGLHLLTVAAGELARLAGPGQFAMLRCSAGWDPYLRRALPFLRLANGAVSFLFVANDPGLAWLAGRSLGEPVSLLGPLGRGFVLYPGTRHLLLIAGGATVSPLLALAERALAAQASVSLVTTAQALGQWAAIVPEAVEVIVEGPDLPWDRLGALLRWADQAAVAGLEADLRRLAGLSEGLRPGRVQCYAGAHLACGLGWCGSCLIEARRGPRRACTSGPVFDLTELI